MPPRRRPGGHRGQRDRHECPRRSRIGPELAGASAIGGATGAIRRPGVSDGQRVAGLERPPAEAAQCCDQIGRPAAEHQRDVQLAVEPDIAVIATRAGGDFDPVAGGQPGREWPGKRGAADPEQEFPARERAPSASPATSKSSPARVNSMAAPGPVSAAPARSKAARSIGPEALMPCCSMPKRPRSWIVVDGPVRMKCRDALTAWPRRSRRRLPRAGSAGRPPGRNCGNRCVR